MVPRPGNPQSLNRYSYVLGNPLKYTDPTGHAEACGSPDGCSGDRSSSWVLRAYYVLGKMYQDYIAAKVYGKSPIIIDASADGYALQRDAIRNQLPSYLWTPEQADEVIASWAVAGTTAMATANFGFSAGGNNLGAVWKHEGLDNVETVWDAAARLAAPTLPGALAGGEANIHVYLGVRDDRPVYVGITNDLGRRQSEHSGRFYVRQLTPSPVTRGQARAIEQALIVQNPQFENINNSISPRHPWYQDAVNWGEWWLQQMGYQK